MNDLPQLTARLAASARPPKKLETQFVGEGGATLKRHWEAGNALDAIRKGKLDYVVLQDQSTLGLGVRDPSMFHTYARQFDAEIKKAGARTVFFLTWARQDSPHEQALLTNAYVSISEELKAALAPVGVAWQMALKENPNLVLHHSDGSHPGAAGSYLAACVFYAVLFSSSPEGLSRDNQSAEDAAFLQRIAWQTAKDPNAVKVQPVEVPAAKVRPAATAAALERGRAIFEAAQKAAGGRERLRGVRDVSVTFSGKWITPQGDVPIEAHDTMVFPALARSEFQASAGGQIVSIVRFFDGLSGWEKTPQGLRDMPDVQKQVYRAEAMRNTLSLLRGEGDFSVQFEKREKVGEADAEVILITKKGQDIRMYIEAATGMVLKKAFRGMGTGGMADIEEAYSDYREIAGIQVPFRVERTQNGSPLTQFTVKEVKFNTGVDPAELAKKPQ